MGSVILLPFLLAIVVLVRLPSPAISGQVFTQFIHPNFSASFYQYIDVSGVFLKSENETFAASLSRINTDSNSIVYYYFSVVHVPSNQLVWTANRNKPFSESDILSLTVDGLVITDASGPVWSTPALGSRQVSKLQLQESGNLVLLDGNDVLLWQSFDYPTDTIVIGQSLSVGNSLTGAIGEEDLSLGDYKFMVTSQDAVLQWKGMTYWKLSMESNAYQNSDSPVSFFTINATGFYLLGNSSNGSTVVFQVNLPHSGNFRIAKLETNGKFNIKSFVNGTWEQDFRSPSEDCQIPLNCQKMGVCSTGACSCPPYFGPDPRTGAGCFPTNTSLSLPSACNNGNQVNGNSVFSYINLGYGIDYFGNDFTVPVKRGTSLSVCQDLCTKNCSCLGFFHGNTTGSCYLLENNLGSVMSVPTSKSDRLGYIKAIVVSTPRNKLDSKDGRKFPIAGLVLLPTSGFLLLVIFVTLACVYMRRNKLSTTSSTKFGRSYSSSSSELQNISIPGLPIKFEYEELEVATENFKTIVGSGGFGTVYKGVLPDQSIVAVKKIHSLGVQGKKEFCSEIAVIGNLHHVNLVKLRGFCAQRKQWFLVYEYMNRGSLDRALFGDGPVLEWRERFEIAIGTARGLAYLHTWCEHKIIHCDVKPENILLHDNLQVKITDFGLAKLLSPEQSSLFTTLRGTRGYLAPEWVTGSTISDKADVYSYGMVLLEIVRGRKNSSPQTHAYSRKKDSSSRGNSSSSSSSGSGSESRSAYFPLFALEMHEKRSYLKLADSRLHGRVTSNEVEKLVRVALCCLHEEPTLRPSMANVVSMLEGTMALGDPRLDSLNFLRFCGQRFTEASQEIEGSSTERNVTHLSRQDQENVNYNSPTSDSYNSMLSYISSQQISGPR